MCGLLCPQSPHDVSPDAVPHLHDTVKRLHQQELGVTRKLHLRDGHHTVLTLPVLVVSQCLEAVARVGVEYADEPVVGPRGQHGRVQRRKVDRHDGVAVRGYRLDERAVEHVPDLDALVHGRREEQVAPAVVAEGEHWCCVTKQPVQRAVQPHVCDTYGAVIGRRGNALAIGGPAHIGYPAGVLCLECFVKRTVLCFDDQYACIEWYGAELAIGRDPGC